MNIHKWQLGFFIALIVLGLYLSFQTIKPFLSILFLAIVLAVIFQPLYKKLKVLFLDNEWVASAFSVILIMIIVMLPVAFFGFLLFDESTSLYIQIRSGTGTAGVSETIFSNLQGLIDNYSPYAFNIRSYVDVGRYVGSATSWLVNNSSVFVSSVLTGALNFFLLILALFYTFKDGDRLVKRLVEISPLKDSHDQTILDKVHRAVDSVIRGHIIIALIQGLLSGFGFWMLGVPSPVIWGLIAAIASFIPTLGTGLVIIPVALYLFFIGSATSGVILVLWGLLIVGLVDNIIGPKLIERGVKIHPFLILIFVLGGIQLFGPIGFIAGPVILSLLFALLDIYPLMVESHNE